MRRLMMLGAAGVLLIATHAVAAGQSKTIPGRTLTVTATVESIDFANREVVGKKPDGTYEEFYFPETFKRFDTLKVGDTITAKYYENIVLRLKPAGEKDVDTASGEVVRAAGTSGTVSRQRTITATITALDPSVPSVTFTGPNGWKYSTRVEDTAALAKVKVGDKVDLTWTEATILSLEDRK